MTKKEKTVEQLISELEQLKEENTKLNSMLNSGISARNNPDSSSDKLITLFQKIVKPENEGHWQLDTDMVTANASDMVLKMLGVSAEDLTGKSFFDYMYTEDKDEREQQKTRLKNTQTSYHYCGFKYADGNEVPAIISSTAQTDSEGNFQSFSINTYDLSELLKCDTIIKKNTEQMEFLLGSMPAAIYSAPVDKEIDTLYITGNVKDITGFTPVEYMSENKFWQNRIHPDDKERVLNLYRNGNLNQEISFEYRWKCADGNYKWFYDRCILKNRNAHQEYIGVIMDITALKQAQEALKNSENSYMGLFNSVSDAIYVHKEDGIFMDVNDGACKMYGYTRDELVGMNPSQVSAPDLNNMDFVKEKIQAVLATGKPQQFEFWGKSKSGQVFLKDVILNKGKYFGEDVIITTARDITERKLNEDKIKQQNVDLQRLNAEKDMFFSIIAHDLRSPFNGFLGLTEIMADRLMTMTVTELQNHASIMKGSAINLFRLLENLLEWTQMRKGVTVYRPQVFALEKVVSEALKTTTDIIKNKEINFEINIPDKMFVYADIHMVESVCRNITSNAVKFTPRGGSISIFTSIVEEKYIAISIKDSGIGMDKDMVDNIFHIDRNYKRRGTEGEPSSGLGMLLCKEFVDKNRGKIWVESTVGEGSTFTFTLPLFFKKSTDDEASDFIVD